MNIPYIIFLAWFATLLNKGLKTFMLLSIVLRMNISEREEEDSGGF